jgi:hypothetical protein
VSDPYRRFRHLAIERYKPAPTPAQMAEVEAALGAKLPNLVRDFLIAAQGGSIDYVFDVPLARGKTEPMVFGQIFAVADLPAEIASAREHLAAPIGVLPFARDGGDSTVLIDAKGKVVAALTGRPEWTGRKRASGFVDLAPSFDAYLDGLHVDRDRIVEGLYETAKTPAHVEATVTYLDIGLPGWNANSKIAAAVARARKRVAPAPKVPSKKS